MPDHNLPACRGSEQGCLEFHKLGFQGLIQDAPCCKQGPRGEKSCCGGSHLTHLPKVRGKAPV